MHFLDIPLRKFWLHDSSIQSITVHDSQIIFGFKSGFYNEKHEQLKNGKILISIRNLNSQNFSCFCSVINRTALNKEISLEKFQKCLKKHCYIIDVDYYSEFERSILLLGYINKKQIEFKVTDVEQIDFFFE